MDLVVGFNVLDCWLVVSCCSYLFIVWLEFVGSSDLVAWCCGLVLLLLVLLLMLVSGWLFVLVGLLCRLLVACGFGWYVGCLCILPHLLGLFASVWLLVVLF